MNTGRTRATAKPRSTTRGRNPVEAAYARSDLFERRRDLMDDWAAYLDDEG